MYFSLFPPCPENAYTDGDIRPREITRITGRPYIEIVKTHVFVNEPQEKRREAENVIGLQGFYSRADQTAVAVN